MKTFFLFSVPFQASAPGVLELNAAPNDDDFFGVNFFDSTQPTTSVGFCDTSIDIVGIPQAEIIVAPNTDLRTNEDGLTDEFFVVLTQAPTATVTIDLSSSDESEGRIVGDTTLTFNAGNWSTPQGVTVQGQDDNVADGPVVYSIVTSAASSEDPSYSGLDPDDVMVTNDDNEQPAFVIEPTGPLVTSETGTNATFSLRLATRPENDVRVTFAVGDPSEGSLDRQVVTFTPMNWQTPREFTVTGVDDDRNDGDVLWTISSMVETMDSGYAALPVPQLNVINEDDGQDIPGITVAPTILETTESGGTAQFTIVLDSEPAEVVSIDVASSDTSEGQVNVPAVQFTPANWNAPQTVTSDWD